ncbi:MAG: FMN-binding protein [Proteobacteria bacterium]|nr:FMN-binding protein [Pseudomonadota bacterium]
MSENTKALVFAAVLSLVCCVLITAACTGLQKYQKINAELDRQINIIKSVGLVEPGKSYKKEDINRLYSDHIVGAWALESGHIAFDDPVNEKGALPLYLYKEGGVLSAYIIPLDSRGLWGRIHGYLALKSDGETIEGFTVFNHAETPGLGGEIQSDWFGRNFKGKKIVDANHHFVSISIAKGTAKDRVTPQEMPNYVDGISGATLTGNYLTQGFKETLERFEPLSQELRLHGTSGIRFKE